MLADARKKLSEQEAVRNGDEKFRQGARPAQAVQGPVESMRRTSALKRELINSPAKASPSRIAAAPTSPWPPAALRVFRPRMLATADRRARRKLVVRYTNQARKPARRRREVTGRPAFPGLSPMAAPSRACSPRRSPCTGATGADRQLRAQRARAAAALLRVTRSMLPGTDCWPSCDPSRSSCAWSARKRSARPAGSDTRAC